MRRLLAFPAALVLVGVAAVTPAVGVADQSPKRGGTVVVGGAAVREPGCLNAYLERCGSGQPNVGNLMGLALRGAFAIGNDNVYRPDLVSGVDVTITSPYTLTYHIRAEARWSDGVPITARDFVFTDAALRSVKDEIDPGQWQTYAPVRSVTAVDEKTVRVVLRSRFAGWRSLFPRVLPSHALRGEDFAKVWLDGIRNPKTGSPIGSGPFLFESWQRGRAVTFIRNPRFWKSHPAYLNRLVVRFCDPCASIADEQVTWLRSGEVDVLMTRFLSGPQVRDLRMISGVRSLAGPSANWEHLDVRVDEGGNPLLGVKLVRQALAYGIDRVAIARARAPLDPRYLLTDSAVFLPVGAHYQPNWRRYRYSPGEARRLLERAGCRRGPDGIYVCGERRLSLRLATVGANATREHTLELIQRQLRQVGIEIVPVYSSPNVLYLQTLPSGDFDLALYAWLESPDSPAYWGGMWGCGGAVNYSGYCQRLTTRDLDQARRNLDSTRQALVLNRADAQMAKDVPVIPLFENPTVVAYKSSVRDVRITAELDPFVGAENWWLDR